MMMEVGMDKAMQTEVEAAAFRRLVAHLARRTDVQNIDLMIHGGFCRNCLADWYGEAAGERGVTLSKDEAREVIYGMRSEEHTSELQSLMRSSYAVFRLRKKKHYRHK